MIHFLGSWIMQSIFHDEISKYFDGNWSYYTDWLGREFSTDDPKWAQAWRFEYMQQTYVRGVVTTWAAFVAAYGVGQLCSMVLKQSLLAGFLAILLALILAIWSVLMYLWQMNPHGFVLPIGLAALLATWLRVPNWILGKNHWRHWLAPAAVLLIPLVGMVALVPTMRMAQLTNITREKPLLNELFAEADSRQAATKNQVAQTALEYERLAAEIDEQEEMFMKSMHSHPDLANEGLQQLAECVTELTKRSESQFPVLHVLTGSPAGNYLAKLRLLLTQDSLRLQSQGKLDLALDRLGAELRLLGHMLRNQQSHTFAMLLQQEGMGTFTETFAAILDWAQATDQTSDQLKSAIGTLQEVFAALPQPSDAIYAYREHVRQIILEENPPSAHNQLAAAFNRLPGEQERALRALDILAAQAQEYVIVIEQLIQGTSFAEPYGVYQASQLRSDLRSAPWTNLYAIYPSMFRRDNAAFRTANQLADACATSFLVANEFRSSGNLRDLLIKWTVSEAQRRALLVQLALLAYRLDHGAYPETLAELVPDYLPTMINDPYSGEAFEYRPEGLNLPLVDGNEYVNRRAPNIPPGTSLLWSVGLGNNVLEEFFEYPADFDWTKGGHVPVGAEERAEAENSGRQVLRFNPTEHFGGGTFRLVFPLPKIEAKPAVKE